MEEHAIKTMSRVAMEIASKMVLTVIARALGNSELEMCLRTIHQVFLVYCFVSDISSGSFRLA